MKIKLYLSIVIVLLFTSLQAFYTETLEANTELAERDVLFAGSLYSAIGCQKESELLEGVSYLAENRTTGYTYSSVTGKNGRWYVVGTHPGDLIKVTFTLNGKIGCILQEQSIQGFYNLKVCMTTSNSCPYEW